MTEELNKRDSCRICYSVRWPRRAFLKLGGAGMFGLTLRNLYAWQAASGKPIDRDLSVIVIWLTGGLGQLDSFDMKPDAAEEIRGEFSPIATSVPGVQVCELLPNMAQQAHRYTIIRSMTHDQADHGVGQHLMLTGYRQSPSLDYPCIASVVSREKGWRNNMPPYVVVPEMQPLPYFGPGILGSEYMPFAAGNPNASGYAVSDLNLPLDVDWSRMQIRRRMLAAVERQFLQVEKDPRFETIDSFSERALDLMASPKTRQAFDISQEPAKLRERYGYTLTGQGALLARRLVEAGVRFVLVSKAFGTFDTHSSNFKTLRGELPEIDMAVGTLFQDLEERGLLDTTIVLLTGEFGRTPKVNNSNAGRDHWPKAFSLVIGGGGFKRGHVIGATDATADSVKDDPITPEQLTATLYERLGVDYRQVYETSIGRPLKLVDEAEPIRKLYA